MPIRLLKEGIRSKQKSFNTLEKDAQRVNEELQGTFYALHFSYVCFFFLVLVTNDKSILHHDNIQKRKLQNLLKISSHNIVSKSYITVRVIFDFSLYELIDDGKNVLFKVLHFSVKPGLIQYLEFLILF